LRESQQRVQTAADALTRRSAGLLTMTGHPASEAVLGRVRQTLQTAATAPPDVKETLRNGCLTQELGPMGFEGFEALPEVAPGGEPAEDREPKGATTAERRPEADTARKEARSRRSRRRGRPRRRSG
jgi:hypothetical protein